MNKEHLSIQATAHMVAASLFIFLFIHLLAGVPGVAQVNKKIMIHFIYIPSLHM